MNLIGDVKGKTAVMIDDIVDTAGSLCEAAKALSKMGVKSVYACCTHAILSDPAVQRIEDSTIEQLIITNSIPLPKDKESKKIVTLSIADALGDAIVRIYTRQSVSQLFDK
jgi:ribose-phosphate pyrophosphokinase